MVELEEHELADLKLLSACTQKHKSLLVLNFFLFLKGSYHIDKIFVINTLPEHYIQGKNFVFGPLHL